MRYLLAVMIFCMCAVPSYAQSSTPMAEALSGAKWPLTLKAGDLDGAWRVFEMETQGTDPSSSIITAAMMASSGMGSASNSIFTKGETTEIAGVTFLIAYKAKMDPINPEMLSRMSQMPVQTINADTPLKLTLVNMQSVGTITSIRAFNLEEESKVPQVPNFAALGEAPETENVEVASMNAQSMANLHELSTALALYAQDFSNKLPPMEDVATVKSALNAYVKDKDCFTQPGADKPYAVNTILSEHKLAHIAKPVEMVVFYESEPGADSSRCVAFLDGHVKRVSESEWQVLKKKSKIP